MADERKPEKPFVRRRDLRAQREAEARLAALKSPDGGQVDALSAPIEQVEEGAGYATVSPAVPSATLPATPASPPRGLVPPAVPLVAREPSAPGSPAVPSTARETTASPSRGPATGGLRRRDLRARSMPMSFGGGTAATLDTSTEAPANAETPDQSGAAKHAAMPASPATASPATASPATASPATASPATAAPADVESPAAESPAVVPLTAVPLTAVPAQPGQPPAAGAASAGIEDADAGGLAEAPSGVLVDHELPLESSPASRPRTRRETADIPEPKDYGRAGRNLPAAIGVGLAVGLSILAVLIFYPPAFIGIAVLGIVGALWELSSALSRSGAQVARIPTMTAGACMALATALAGREALWVAFAIGAGAILLWTLFERRPNAVKDVSLGIFALTYVGLMASFIVHMITLERGNLLVITFLAVVIASDVGGYAFGVLWGKHPIAPRISPKKSWEGFAGSVLVGSGIGVTLSIVMMDAPWWCGIVLGMVIPAVATLGDFSESMIKRDLSLKDMGTLMPGHGGIMDRLDSILPTAPVALALFTALPGFIA